MSRNLHAWYSGGSSSHPTKSWQVNLREVEKKGKIRRREILARERWQRSHEMNIFWAKVMDTASVFLRIPHLLFFSQETAMHVL